MAPPRGRFETPVGVRGKPRMAQTFHARELATGGQMTQWPADQVERRSVSALVPYARNARSHRDEQVAQIAASIREWGWAVPLE